MSSMMRLVVPLYSHKPTLLPLPITPKLPNGCVSVRYSVPRLTSHLSSQSTLSRRLGRDPAATRYPASLFPSPASVSRTPNLSQVRIRPRFPRSVLCFPAFPYQTALCLFCVPLSRLPPLSMSLSHQLYCLPFSARTSAAKTSLVPSLP